MRYLTLLPVLLIGCAHGAPKEGPPFVATPADEEHARVMARAFMGRYSQGDTPGAEYYFDDKLRGALPPQKLWATWGDMTAKYGVFQGVEDMRVVPIPDGLAVIQIARFEHGYQAVTISISSDGEIRAFATNASAILEQRFIAQLTRGEFGDAVGLFDDSLRATASPDQVAEFWNKLLGDYGAYRYLGPAARVDPIGETWQATIAIHFAHKVKTMRVVVSNHAQIVGFSIE